MALGNPASQNSQYETLGPALATDGNLNNNMHSAKSDTPRWWRVDLLDRHHLAYAVLYNSNHGELALLSWLCPQTFFLV